MARLRQTTRKVSQVFKVAAPKIDEQDWLPKFTSNVNKQLSLISERFARIPEIEGFDPTDYVQLADLRDEIIRIDEEDESLVDTEGEEEGEIGGGGGRKRQRRTTRFRRRAWELIGSAGEAMEPTAAPPNVAAASAIGTTTSASTGDLPRFALEDHTHGGVLGAPVAGGVAEQIAFFTSSFEVDGDAELTYNATTNILTVPNIYGFGGTGNPLTLRSNSASDDDIVLGDTNSVLAGVIINATAGVRTINIAGIDLQTFFVVNDHMSVAGGFGSANAETFALRKYASTLSTAATRFVFSRARGTLGAETAVVDNDFLGRFAFAGYGDTTYQRGARITCEVDDPTPSDTSMGARLIFETTPVGGISPLERLSVEQDGEVIVQEGLSVLTDSLDINGLGYAWPGAHVAGVLTNNGGGVLSWTAFSGVDHGSLGGLADDDHTQYALLAGRSGGQVLIGGTAAGNDLTLQSTSNATRGSVFFGSAATTFFDETTDDWTFQGQAVEYNNIALVSVGLPSIVAEHNSTGNTANIGIGAIYAVPADGFYRVSATVQITTVASTSSTLPQVNIVWTDGDGAGAQSLVLTGNSTAAFLASPYGATVITGVGSNLLTTRRGGDTVIWADAGTNISFSTSGYASLGATAMVYAVHIRVEAL